MHFSLGIDAGGTYTDVVIISDSNGDVVESGKALTTYPDPLPGMKNAIDKLNPEYLKDINLYPYPPRFLPTLFLKVPVFRSD